MGVKEDTIVFRIPKRSPGRRSKSPKRVTLRSRSKSPKRTQRLSSPKK